MKVYQALASAMSLEGAGGQFGVMGDGNLLIWSALAGEHRVHPYAARHEGAAVGMADGYHRATGELGVAMITCGPGVTQTATALVTAVRNRSSIVVVAGDTPNDSKDRGQALDQRRFVEACGARFHAIDSLHHLDRQIREAFYEARFHRIPVFLNVSTDFQEHDIVSPWSYIPSGQFAPSPATVRPDPACVETLAHLLRKAERPVFVAGRGAVIADARRQIEALADRTGALLATSLPAKGFFRSHPYDLGVCGGYSTAPTEKLVSQADLIVGFGAEMGFFTTRDGWLFKNAEVVRVDVARNPRDIGIAPGLYIRGDARATAEAVEEILAGQDHTGTGYRGIADDILSAPTPAAPPVVDGINPRTLMQDLSALLPENAVLTLGLGHFLAFPCMYLNPPAGVDTHYSHQFGSIGQALALALGVGIGSPGRPSIMIEGDGGLAMSIQELETAARHGLALVILLCNDSGFGAEFHKLAAKNLDPGLAQWPSPDFVAIVKGFGGDGVLVDRQDQVVGALRDGLASNGLYLIDIRISPTAVSDTFRRLYYGLPNTAPLLRD